MHAMKGLEFRCVAVIGVNDRAFPFDAAVTPIEVDRMQHSTCSPDRVVTHRSGDRYPRAVRRAMVT
jgi:superfamily I DNA/RNA helicase